MVVVSKFLQPLFQWLCHQVLHFLCGCARPCRCYCKYFDREDRLFGAAQLKVGKSSGKDHCQKKEESDGAFPHRECRKVDALCGVPFLLKIRFQFTHLVATFSSETRTCCPSL